ncbi:MAG TPA: CoA pyrophosphatase [Candidatus Acidoferrales bacterium]|nr:CoA pyrophosphatase [Candidatus Acidoferrales bacterium]
MTIDVIRERVAAHKPVTVAGTGYAHAAVAIVLREADEGAEFVVIRRSHRDDDPWSGHMALPGGRQDPADRDLFMTATRETHEEVGIDLQQYGELLGHLDELRAIGRGRPLDLVITPFVCAVTAPVSLTPNHREVQQAFWLPLAALRRREAQGSFRHEINGQPMEHQAFIYQGHTIWGLTYRILTQLLEVVT